MLGDEVALPISRGNRNKIIQALSEQDSVRRLKKAELVIEANSGSATPD